MIMAEKNPNYYRLKKVFHDRWVATIKIDGIEVDNTFEGAIAPERIAFILWEKGHAV
jgi:hypothetical protein